MQWYREQNVDAVVIAGDLADQGLCEQLQTVADAWYRVFPNDRRSDGGRVEKVFVSGNHDWEGWHYNDLYKRRFPDRAERMRQLLRQDYAGNWERIFREPYAPIYLKDIKGYRFIGSHWDGSDGDPVAAYSRIESFLKVHAAELPSSRPFFYIQHPHPKDTCYGSWAWGHDEGAVTRCLSAFPNAVAISGHSHYSLTDERSIWQGAFTSLGAGSLSYTGIPYDERPGEGYENSRTGQGGWRVDARKLMPVYSTGSIVGGNLFGGSHQGMLLDVYDGSIVVRRRDFAHAADLGDDWILPLPVSVEKPHDFSVRARSLRAPEFSAGVVLKVDRVQAKCRGGRSPDGKESIPPTSVSACRLHIPAANAVFAARVKCYEVVLREGPHRLVRQVLAEGFHLPPAHERTSSETTCTVGPIGDGPLTLEVTPLGWFGARGKPLTARL